MNRARLLFWTVPAALLAACWPVGRWYVRRMTDGGDDAWGLLALVTLALVLAGRQWRNRSAGHRTEAGIESSLAGPTLLLAVYVAAYPFATPLPRAALAVAMLGTLLANHRWGGSLPAAGWGLLLLSLPLMASLQYYFGYPFRVLAARLSIPLLGLVGIPTASLGTGLLWRGELVLVDAPCSGLRMLWAGVWLALVLAAWRGLPWLRTAAATAGALVVVVAGNALRSATLFVKETGRVPLPDWAHAGIGLVVFAACAAAIAAWVRLCTPHPGRLPRSSMISTADFDVRCSFPDQIQAPRSQVPPPFSIQRSTFDLRRSFSLALSFLQDYTALGILRRRLLPLFFSLCALAALLPLLPGIVPRGTLAAGFPGWPATFEGRRLQPLPLGEADRSFLGGFPGRVGKFTDGRREILLRWVSEPSRRLHPAADCLRGAGAEVRPLPVWRDRRGRLWGCQEIVRNGQHHRILERIIDAAGWTDASRPGWTDVSAWYWAALLGRTNGPWWAITVAERIE
jgi:exosortase/archaeosortase family protein